MRQRVAKRGFDPNQVRDFGLDIFKVPQSDLLNLCTRPRFIID